MFAVRTEHDHVNEIGSVMEAGEILLRSGLLDERKLQLSRDSQRNGSVLDAAVELGFVSEDKALQAVGQEVGLDFIDLTVADVDTSLLSDFPQKIIYRDSLFPISRENGSITVATSDPFDLYPLDEVSSLTGLSVIPVLAGKREIANIVLPKSSSVGDLDAHQLQQALGLDPDLLIDYEEQVEDPAIEVGLEGDAGAAPDADAADGDRVEVSA